MIHAVAHIQCSICETTTEIELIENTMNPYSGYIEFFVEMAELPDGWTIQTSNDSDENSPNILHREITFTCEDCKYSEE